MHLAPLVFVGLQVTVTVLLMASVGSHLANMERLADAIDDHGILNGNPGRWAAFVLGIEALLGAFVLASLFDQFPALDHTTHALVAIYASTLVYYLYRLLRTDRVVDCGCGMLPWSTLTTPATLIRPVVLALAATSLVGSSRPNTLSSLDLGFGIILGSSFAVATILAPAGWSVVRAVQTMLEEEHRLVVMDELWDIDAFGHSPS